jgi:hypothetical protein
MTKATLSQMNKQLKDQKDKAEKEQKKSNVQKKEQELMQAEAHIPRGERGDFIKTSITIPCDLLAELRALGMKRKGMKMKDTDTSALIREAIIDFLNKHKAN